MTYVAAIVGLAVLCAVWVVVQRANGGSESFPGVCRRCDGDCGGSREDCPWSRPAEPPSSQVHVDLRGRTHEPRLREEVSQTRDTQLTRSRYQRIAPVYDAFELLAEHRYRPWRRELWSRVRGPGVLEVGVGTGKNIPFYPPDLDVTAVDLTPGMLERARPRAAKMGLEVDLRLGDVQSLEFPDNSFGAAVATFVFF